MVKDAISILLIIVGFLGPIFLKICLQDYYTESEINILFTAAICLAVWLLTVRYYKTKEQIKKLRHGTWVSF
jgi:positive regulator of sigma E activity